MTHSDWKTRYTKYREIAERICRMRTARARTACREAGLDPTLLGIHPHNAMIDFRAGKPWPGVDYSKVRLCLRLLDRLDEGARIVDRWDDRVRREAV